MKAGFKSAAKLLVVATGLLSLSVFAQDNLRETLFAKTDAALVAANEANASVLAPKSYAEASKYYRQAEDKLRRNRSIDSIKKDLLIADQALRKAVESTRLANVTLTTAIQARNDADEASAVTFAAEEWRQAEEKFAAAAARLEDGNVNSARSRANDAEKLYRAAELAAVKTNYLDEARRLIDQSHSENVDRYAPKTLASAESLLAEAENALNKDRYDTDRPRSLARQAKYQAQHALYLAQALKPIRDREMTLEDFALANEKPVARIAAMLDIVPAFDQGFEPTTQQIGETIEKLQKDAYELGERRAQIVELEDEIQKLGLQLGTQSERLAIQETQRQRFRQIESLFGRGEAQIFTQGQNALIRPVGLVFQSGSAQIEARNFGLLAKIQDAIRAFPDSTIVIEGHTDSFGGDELNLDLSQKRADAVREYLLANMRDLSGADVQSVGYGESRPVANNETEDGRAKNRRIDVLIQPKA